MPPSRPASGAQIDPPVGRVTLVFTDIQQSTPLWDRAPEAMQAAMAVHDRVLREALAEHGGYEVRTEGDAFILSFTSPLAAVRCCLTAQQRLAEASWGQSILNQSEAAVAPGFRGLRVRMGAHMGEPTCQPDPTTGRMDYHGAVVIRAARIARAAHGGQILLSSAVWSAVRDAVAAEVAHADLGTHRLQGLEEPDQLVSVLPLALRGRTFPPIRTLDVRKTNLEARPTSFVGRAAELAQIERLYQDGARLVTLLGPGGIGKTRLATTYGSLFLSRYVARGGAWLCELSHAASASGVLHAVASTLGVPLNVARTLDENVAQLGRAIAGRGQCLLILDNLEQATGPAADVLGAWLLLAPEARILATSRERLRLDGETCLELAPLTPDDAVQLFVERARAARPSYDPGDQDRAIIAEITERLDGIPLALELAASRANTLAPRMLLEQLSRRLDVLRQPVRGAPVRQSTLRHTLDWSWALLSEAEQGALAQIAVFQGGFTLDAAEAVLDLSHLDEQPWTVDLVEALRDKSLLRASEQPGRPGELRFSMYGLIHEYALEKLDRSRLRPETERRHRAWIVPMAEELAAGVDRHGGAEKLRRLADEAENLEAAHLSALRLPRDPETAVRALLALAPVFDNQGPLGAHVALLDAAVAASAEASPRWRLRALVARAEALRRRGRLDLAENDLEAARRWASQVDEPSARALVHLEAGRNHRAHGQLKAADAELRAGLEAATAAGDRPLMGIFLSNIGVVAVSMGKLQDAERSYQAALAIHREVGNQRAEGILLKNWATLCRLQYRYVTAERYLRDALIIDEVLGARATLASAQRELGVLKLDQGRLVEAEPVLQRALALSRDLGAVAFQGPLLYYLGLLYLERGDEDRAEEHLLPAVSAALSASNKINQGIAWANLGLLRLLQRRHVEAQEHFSEGIRLVGDAGFHRTLGPMMALRAISLLELGGRSAALEDLRRASALVANAGPVERTLVMLCSATYEVLACDMEGPALRERVQSICQKMEVKAGEPLTSSWGPTRGAPAPASCSADVRLALALMRRAAATALERDPTPR